MINQQHLPVSLKGLIAAACMIGISGCVTTTSSVPEAASSNISEDPRITQEDILESTAGFILSALPPQKLEPGECGLFLFTERPTPRFVFFGQSAKQQGLVRHYGDELELVMVESSGEVFDQTFSEQSFEAPSKGIKIHVSLNEYVASDNGARVPSGSLRLTDAEGWVTVTPVAGATACNTDVVALR